MQEGATIIDVHELPLLRAAGVNVAEQLRTTDVVVATSASLLGVTIIEVGESSSPRATVVITAV